MNINLTKARQNEYAKYQIGPNIKLFTNNVKVAIIVAPVAIALGLSMNQSDPLATGLYVVSGCALAYAGINLYLHKKEKQKKFTLK